MEEKVPSRIYWAELTLSRRWFILEVNGKLTYYSARPGVKGAKLLGWMDTKTCSAVLPGGRCIDCDWPRASLQYCFGMISPQRKLFLIADSVPDLSGWLRCLRDMLSPEIPVTNAREIEVSFKPQAPLPAIPAEPKKPNRITLLRNGVEGHGKVVSSPPDLPACLALASSELGISARRLFNEKGGEITDFTLLRDNDVVYVSEGEDFKDTAMERLLRTAMTLADNAAKKATYEAMPKAKAKVVEELTLPSELQETQPVQQKPVQQQQTSAANGDQHSDDDDGEFSAPFTFSNPALDFVADQKCDPEYVSAAMLRERAAEQRAAAEQQQASSETEQDGMYVECGQPMYAEQSAVSGADNGGYAEQAGRHEAGYAEHVPGFNDVHYSEPPAGLHTRPSVGRRVEPASDYMEPAPRGLSLAPAVLPEHYVDIGQIEGPDYVQVGLAEQPGYVCLTDNQDAGGEFSEDDSGDEKTAVAAAPPAPSALLPSAPVHAPLKITSRVQF